MHYLIEFSDDEFQRNFELANEHLKQVFSKYPHPTEMEGCPCCVGKREPPNQDNFQYESDLQFYLRKAMTTWGEEIDFKHYIPQLLSFVYLEKKSDDTFVLLGKIEHVQNWNQDETQAILEWFNTYSQYKYIGELKRLIEESRLKVQDWLEGTSQKLSCDFPFSIFLESEFNEMISFLDPRLLEKFSELLDIWPLNEADFVIYASCLTNYLIFSDSEYGIFKERVSKWISKNENIMEEFFWKTEDPRLQKLFSDALPPNYYPK